MEQGLLRSEASNRNDRSQCIILKTTRAALLARPSLFYLRNGWRVWRANSLGRGKSSPASLDLEAQSTSARYCSNSVISPNHCVPLSLEMVTTLGRSHGPRQPLIVSCTLFSNPLARHSFLSQSTGTGGLPFSVFPQQHPWQTVRCPITSRFVASACVESEDIDSRLVLRGLGGLGKQSVHQTMRRRDWRKQPRGVQDERHFRRNVYECSQKRI